MQQLKFPRVVRKKRLNEVTFQSQVIFEIGPIDLEAYIDVQMIGVDTETIGDMKMLQVLMNKYAIDEVPVNEDEEVDMDQLLVNFGAKGTVHVVDKPVFTREILGMNLVVSLKTFVAESPLEVDKILDDAMKNAIDKEIFIMPVETFITVSRSRGMVKAWKVRIGYIKKEITNE